jgi:aspartate-semialdehyde dehydrogenase
MGAMSNSCVAVVGATGAVGREMVAQLHERSFPASEVKLLASSRSKGQKLRLGDELLTVDEATPASFAGVDLVLMSAGASVARELAPAAARAGAVVVDNSSAFRQDPDVPLVVPEVNAHALRSVPRGIIANPNCSTIQMVVALAPLHREARVRRIVVSTYQSVSGAGWKAMEELRRGCADVLVGREPVAEVFPHPIALDCIPQIAAFEPDGYTVEEHKMIFETHKILEDPSIAITATCVRVPVMRGHSEAVLIETERPLGAERARELLRGAEGVVLIDDPARKLYPLARSAAGTGPVYVGRIRPDTSSEHGLWLWVVADNLLKGAALNAVQIAERLRAG